MCNTVFVFCQLHHPSLSIYTAQNAQVTNGYHSVVTLLPGATTNLMGGQTWTQFNVCPHMHARTYTHTHTGNHAYSSYCTIDTKTGKGGHFGNCGRPGEFKYAAVKRIFFYYYYFNIRPFVTVPQRVSPLAL